MVNKLGILYLATGPYIKFWPVFYTSMENHFCKNSDHFYFVFTDDKTNKIFEGCNNIHFIEIFNMPWPLVTLLRFHFFNMIKDELAKMDYLIFSNANIECCKDVNEAELFENTDLFFTQHPGYYQKKPKYFVLERSKYSTAYVPYREKTKYVIGAFFGGKSKAFLSMSNELKKNIEEDLKRNIIAKWHDESHLNRYYANHQNNRLVSPAYCYPSSFEIPMEPILRSVDKRTVFDVELFKGIKRDQRKNVVYKAYRKLKQLTLDLFQVFRCNLGVLFNR